MKNQLKVLRAMRNWSQQDLANMLDVSRQSVNAIETGKYDPSLPLAFRIILPPLTSEFLNTIKNTAVAITIGLIELTGQARSMQEFSFQVFEAFTAATVIYLLVNFIVVTGMRFLERRVAIPGYISGK